MIEHVRTCYENNTKQKSMEEEIESSQSVDIFEEDPCILFFDSLNQATTNDTDRQLKKFLQTLSGKSINSSIKCSRVNSPRQKNFIDCGAFMLYVIDRIARTNPSTRQELETCMKLSEALTFRNVIKDALIIAQSLTPHQEETE